MRPLKAAEMQEANLTSMVLFMKRVDIAGLGHCDLMNRPGSSLLAHGPGMGLTRRLLLVPVPTPESKWHWVGRASMGFGSIEAFPHVR